MIIRLNNLIVFVVEPVDMWKTFQERQGWLEAWVNPHPWCFQQLPENETLWKKTIITWLIFWMQNSQAGQEL
jgi:hypothetical protein